MASGSPQPPSHLSVEQRLRQRCSSCPPWHSTSMKRKEIQFATKSSGRETRRCERKRTGGGWVGGWQRNAGTRARLTRDTPHTRHAEQNTHTPPIASLDNHHPSEAAPAPAAGRHEAMAHAAASSPTAVAGQASTTSRRRQGAVRRRALQGPPGVGAGRGGDGRARCHRGPALLPGSSHLGSRAPRTLCGHERGQGTPRRRGLTWRRRARARWERTGRQPRRAWRLARPPWRDGGRGDDDTVSGTEEAFEGQEEPRCEQTGQGEGERRGVGSRTAPQGSRTRPIRDRRARDRFGGTAS